MAKKAKKETKAKAEPKLEEPKSCTCRTEQGFRMNPPCSTQGNCKCA